MFEIPLLSFSLSRSSQLNLQKQIQANVVAAIQAGQFKPGARLPSSRKLAKYLDVSRLTVTLAYAELIANGYVVTRDRSGYFISDAGFAHPGGERRNAESTDRPKFKPKFTRRFSHSSHNIVRPENWRGYPYRFIYGQADPSILDHQHWRQCALEALGKRDFNTLILDSYEHDDPLFVEYLLNVTLPRNGIFAKPEEVLITVGAQNALWLCGQLFLDRKTKVTIENPCYPGFRNIIRHQGSKVVALDVDEEGLPVDQIPDDVGVVFVTPSHQTPTNYTMSERRRAQLLDLAMKQNMVIIEDNYEYEMPHLHDPRPSLKAKDRHGHVVYVGSFSKSLFPGIRLGYMVASEEIIREARALRGVMLRHPPGHSQRAVAYFQSLGYLDGHFNRISRHFQSRHHIMREAIIEQGLTSASSLDAGGFSFWMRTQNGIDSVALAKKLQAYGVLIEPGAPFFALNSKHNDFYRLAYSSIDAAKIPEGIRLIRAVMDEMR